MQSGLAFTSIVPHAPLPHTADTGIEATAPTFAALVEELATGMFELMAEADCATGRASELEISSESNEDLVVDTLSELLYLSETGDLHFCRFTVTGGDGHSVHVRAMGVPMRDVEFSGPPIKAVTYHQLEVTESAHHWYGRVYFDV